MLKDLLKVNATTTLEKNHFFVRQKMNALDSYRRHTDRLHKTIKCTLPTQ